MTIVEAVGECQFEFFRRILMLGVMGLLGVRCYGVVRRQQIRPRHIPRRSVGELLEELLGQDFGVVIVEDGDDAIGEILFLLDFRVIAVVFDFLDAFSPPFVFSEFDAHGCDVGVGDVVHVFRHVDIEELGEKIEILIGAVADDIVFELFERFGERVFTQFLVAFLIIFFHDNGVLENLIDIKSVEAIDGFGFEAVDSAGVFLGVLQTAVAE